MEEHDLLFVYGTLMRGYGGEWSGRLADMADYVGEGTCPGRLWMVSWYPGMTEPADDAETVHGEVWAIKDPQDAWPKLDEYEGIIPGSPDISRYRREKVEVSMADGGVRRCYAYILNYPTEDLERITSGDFRTRKQ